MNDHDVTAVLERLIEPLDDEFGSWDDVLRRAIEPPSADREVALDGAERARDPRPALDHAGPRGGRRPHTRRVLVLAAAALVVVGATAAFATARGLFFGSAHTATLDPLWSADGRRISFMRHHWDDGGNVSSELYVMNADGSGQRRFSDALDPRRDVAPILSPSWRKIAFLRNPCTAVQGACTGNSTIYVMNADGGGRHRLARGGSVRKTRSGQREGGGDGYAWSPDGRRLAFLSDRDGNFEIYVVNADGSDERRLTRTPESDGSPAWSPDGRKIAFVRSVRNRYGIPAREEVWVMNADGSGQRALGRGGGPAWSSDGRKIAFRSERTGKAELYLVNLDGSGSARLTRNPGADGHAVWSPNGKRIYFVRGRNGKSDIYSMDADGSRQRNLSRNPEPPGRDGKDNSPVVSPDGRRIAFLSERGGTYQIYVMNADGSGLKRLTQGSGGA
jgi:Tol biopolymer transport system component